MALRCYTLFMLVVFASGYNVFQFDSDIIKSRQIEKDHNPYWLNIPWYLNGTQYLYNINGTQITALEQHTPNWLMEEPPFRPHPKQFPKNTYTYSEINRPYRIYPAYKTVTDRWNYYNTYDQVNYQVGCYCTTAYKIYTPLAGCAVLTYRHILTTATSTELVLKKNRHTQKLDRILGFWYEVYDRYPINNNNSFYSSVSRIHYHPKYLRPEKVNISHPFPFVYDLAIWATPQELPWNYFLASTTFCQRAAPSRKWYEHTKPYPSQKILIIGFQFIKAHGKVPNVWFKYAVRTVDIEKKCPKVEWGEYFCIGEGYTESYAKYGIESGAAFHRLLAEYRPAWWQGYDGLAAMCAFSMNLRSRGLVHYFTVLNVHPVLNWIYDAYVGKQRYVWLDNRYEDTKGKAPMPKPWHKVPDVNWLSGKPQPYPEPLPYY